VTVVCSKCGEINDDESTYCGYCGAVLSSTVTTTQEPEQTLSSVPEVLPEPKPFPQKRSRFTKRTRNFVLVVDAVVIIVVIAFALATTKGANNPTIQLQTLSIVSGSVVVGPNSSTYYQFTVPTTATNAQVKGNFAVTSGGDGVRVYVFDSVYLFIWTNDHNNPNVGAYYKSGLAISGNLNVRLTPGAYYVVFDNSISGSSPKNVQANVSLLYD
jgi:hypothetical protein